MRIGAAARWGALLLPLVVIAVVGTRALVVGPGGVGFGTLEPLQVFPVFLWALVLVRVAYRDVLGTEIMDARRTDTGLVEQTAFGWGVRWAPVLLSWSVPLLFATNVVGAGVAAAVVLACEIAGLEWFRRRRIAEGVGELWWTDRNLEAYRVRWDAAAFTTLLVACSLLAGVMHGEAKVADVAVVGAMVVVISAYLRVFDAFEKDDTLPSGFAVGALLGSAFALAPLGASRMLSSNPVLAVGISLAGVTAFLGTTEWHRRRAIAMHVQRLATKGYGEQLAATYGLRP